MTMMIGLLGLSFGRSEDAGRLAALAQEDARIPPGLPCIARRFERILLIGVGARCVALRNLKEEARRNAGGK